MSILRLQPTNDVYQKLSQQALTCGEFWNIAMTQRRNKYAWGKANAETQMQEIESLQALDPQLQQVPLSALRQVIQDLDTAYTEFLKAKDAFKHHERDSMPAIPAFKPEGFLYPLYYGARHCELKSTGEKSVLQLYLYPKDQSKSEPESALERQRFTLDCPNTESLDTSEGLWVLPVADQLNVYTASSKEAGRMALNEANSTSGTAISGSSPRG